VNFAGMRRLGGLRWLTPRKAFPHGMSGIVSLSSGAVLVMRALFGAVNDVPGLLVGVYVLATVMNAIAGDLVSNSAPKSARTPFKLAARLQIALCWFIARFYLSGASSSESISNEAVHDFERAMDFAFAIGIVGSVFFLAYISFKRVAVTNGKAVATSIFVGCLSLLLLSGYPLQLAFGGEKWYKCVREDYPLQRLGFVFYVYIPATFSFGAMLFGATLLNRGVISNFFFGSFFVGLIVATLFSTVLMQEVHIPFVSTQKLFLICPSPDEGTLMHYLTEALDTSRLAQTVLSIFGFGFLNPMSSKTGSF